MGLEPGFSVAALRPARLCSEHGYVAVVVQLRSDTNHSEEVQRMRSIGLDIHRDFAEVAIAEGGEVRSAGRIEMTPEALELFAQSLGRDDRVALEVSGNAWEVARIIRPQVAELVAVSPADTGSRAARAKTDRLDARALAKLLAAGQLDGVWVPDEETRAMRRRLGRRAQLVE
jgi:transposase